MVVPALAALLPGSVRDLSGDFIPGAWTNHRDKLDEIFV